MRARLGCWTLLLCCCGCRPSGETVAQAVSGREGPAVRFTDVTDTVGIRFKHTSGRSGRLYLPETMGAGCAFLDYNNDGKLDLFLVNSSRLPGFKGQGPFTSALYRNDGDRFTDVTKAAGLAVDCYGMGVAIADYNGDGFQDLYLYGLGPNSLFHNNGDGTFTDITRRAGVGDPRFSTAAAWLDYDRDGLLDLFVGNYCHWTPETNQVCFDSSGRHRMCPPSEYAGVASVLYHSNGDGTFSDVTKQAGLDATKAGKALGVLVWDVNDDGWLDLVVANDQEPNLLFQNNGDGTFTERGVQTGIAYGSHGIARAGMGIDSADTTNTGRESVVIGNFTDEGLGQFLVDEQGQFTDVAEETGLFQPSLPFLTFGVLFMDYDGDGYKDLFTANGHVGPTAESPDAYAMRMLAFRNDGAGRFQEVAERLSPTLGAKRVWRGLAMGDYDNDGDPDLLVTVCNDRPALLRNDGGNQRPWLQVKAVAAGKNRDGIGTKVIVTAGGVRQTGWIRSGSSYCSQNELKAFFGLGEARQAEEVELLFPSGRREVVQAVKADQLIVVQEGRGLVAQGVSGSLAAKLLPAPRRPVIGEVAHP